MKYHEIEVITGDSTNPSIGMITLPEGSFISITVSEDADE